MAEEAQRTAPKFRRVVTGHDSGGRPMFWIDGDATNHKFPSDKISSTMMWSTQGSPTELFGAQDEGARILGSAPPPTGSRFTMMEFAPGNAGHLHRTDTVDYVICVAGEIDMFLDDTRFVTLHAGDVLIQRGTDHAWVNRSDKPCRLAVVLLDATPKRQGSISGLVSAGSYYGEPRSSRIKIRSNQSIVPPNRPSAAPHPTVKLSSVSIERQAWQ